MKELIDELKYWNSKDKEMAKLRSPNDLKFLS